MNNKLPPISREQKRRAGNLTNLDSGYNSESRSNSVKTANQKFRAKSKWTKEFLSKKNDNTTQKERIDYLQEQARVLENKA